MTPSLNRHPDVKPIGQWLPGSQACYDAFRRWLREGGYGGSSLTLYAAAARVVFGWLDKTHWDIDPDADIERVRRFVTANCQAEATAQTYLKGIAKLEEFLRFRRGKPKPQKAINWAHYLAGLPDWLAADVRAFVAHRGRSWVLEQRYRSTLTTLSHLTQFLRWAARRMSLPDISVLTPEVWYDYLDERMAAGRSHVTVNVELSELCTFLHFLADQGRPVCQRLFRVPTLKLDQKVPRDVPPDHLRTLLAEVEKQATLPDPLQRRQGLMDRAWVLLMLYSGLRTGEVRRLRLDHLELSRRCVRIERSKGLKDRIVCLSTTTTEAVTAYLEVRGPAAGDYLFMYRHRPLSDSYCGQRLRTYGRRCGFKVTPHMLRHSCGTLLLNAGAPILTVQTILGHQHIDTTRNYARLYNGTVAADYYRAVDQVEAQMELQAGANGGPPNGGQLLALIDTLGNGTLNEEQRETVAVLRAGLLTLVEAVGREP